MPTIFKRRWTRTAPLVADRLSSPEDDLGRSMEVHPECMTLRFEALPGLPPGPSPGTARNVRTGVLPPTCGTWIDTGRQRDCHSGTSRRETGRIPDRRSTAFHLLEYMRQRMSFPFGSDESLSAVQTSRKEINLTLHQSKDVSGSCDASLQPVPNITKGIIIEVVVAASEIGWAGNAPLRSSPPFRTGPPPGARSWQQVQVGSDVRMMYS